MLLKIMLGLLAVGFLFLARGLKSFHHSRKNVRNRRERWASWADDTTDEDD